MRHRGKIFIAISAAVLLAGSGVHAQNESAESGKVSPQITSCLVYSVKSSSKIHDCTMEAKKAADACNRAQTCEVPIGYNLTSGNDIDSGSGFLGKQVKITYTCGEIRLQSGPYNQDDHASVVLDCSGMWW